MMYSYITMIPIYIWYLHALLAANDNHDNGAPTPLVRNHAKT